MPRLISFAFYIHLCNFLDLNSKLCAENFTLLKKKNNFNCVIKINPTPEMSDELLPTEQPRVFASEKLRSVACKKRANSRGHVELLAAVDGLRPQMSIRRFVCFLFGDANNSPTVDSAIDVLY